VERRHATAINSYVLTGTEQHKGFMREEIEILAYERALPIAL